MSSMEPCVLPDFRQELIDDDCSVEPTELSSPLPHPVTPGVLSPAIRPLSLDVEVHSKRSNRSERLTVLPHKNIGTNPSHVRPSHGE
jgi:hypothetical protein